MKFTARMLDYCPKQCKRLSKARVHSVEASCVACLCSRAENTQAANYTRAHAFQLLGTDICTSYVEMACRELYCTCCAHAHACPFTDDMTATAVSAGELFAGIAHLSETMPFAHAHAPMPAFAGDTVLRFSRRRFHH